MNNADKAQTLLRIAENTHQPNAAFLRMIASEYKWRSENEDDNSGEIPTVDDLYFRDNVTPYVNGRMTERCPDDWYSAKDHYYATGNADSVRALLCEHLSVPEYDTQP